MISLRSSELAFQNIESQHNLKLSLSFSTPNIASKGRLTARSVVVPSSLNVTNQPKAPGTPKPALIQEITPPKGILKNTANRAEKVPVWKWSQAGSQIVLTICVPELVSRIFPSSFSPLPRILLG